MRLRGKAIDILKYMYYGNIGWLHRSVYEYIKEHESDAHGDSTTSSRAEVSSSLHQGRIGLLIYGPTEALRENRIPQIAVGMGR